MILFLWSFNSPFLRIQEIKRSEQQARIDPNTSPRTCHFHQVFLAFSFSHPPIMSQASSQPMQKSKQAPASATMTLSVDSSSSIDSCVSSLDTLTKQNRKSSRRKKRNGSRSKDRAKKRENGDSRAVSAGRILFLVTLLVVAVLLAVGFYYVLRSYER